MNSDCVEGLITECIDLFRFRIASKTYETLLRICLHGLRTLLFCSVQAIVFGAFMGPMPKVCIAGVVLLLKSLLLLPFISMEFVRLKLQNETKRRENPTRRGRDPCRASILRRCAEEREQSTRDAVPDTPTTSVAVTEQPALNISRFPTKMKTPITTNLRGSSKSSHTERTRSRHPRSPPGFKTIIGPLQDPMELQGSPDFRDPEMRVPLMISDSFDAKTFQRSKEQILSTQFQQLRISETRIIPVVASSMRSRHSSGKNTETPDPETNVPNISPILGAGGRIRSMQSVEDDKILNSQ